MYIMVHSKCVGYNRDDGRLECLFRSDTGISMGYTTKSVFNYFSL